jgi:hypothetical protein
MFNRSRPWTEETLTILTHPGSQAGIPQGRSVTMVEGKQQKVLTKKQLQFETYEQGHVTAIEVQKSHAVVEYRMHLEFLSERNSSQHHKPLLASS